ncbi:MAG: GIY-YIG nuclease family protein [Candidatus Pacebacteria bacterium]|nr:GIY-YIG nuclease family protein [Candidatus Paceibacterota bacterium]
MYYVYILRSDKGGSRYVGTTSDLRRLWKNVILVTYSSTRTPFFLAWYPAFSERACICV